MHSIKFYRQARYDGGVRSGIGVDGTLVMHHFAPGHEDDDPALRWFVDLIFESDTLPSEAEAARDLLLRQSTFAQHVLRDTAEHLALGIDDEEWPYTVQFKDEPSGITCRLTTSGVRSLADDELAANLAETADNWRTHLNRLELSEQLSR